MGGGQKKKVCKKNPEKASSADKGNSSSSSNSNSEIPDDTEVTVDVNPYLTYDVLRMLFKYLGFKDLISAAKVCRSWLDAASKEMKLRQEPSVHYLHFLPQKFNSSLQKTTECNTFTSGIVRCKPEIGFFFTYVRLLTRDIGSRDGRTSVCYCKELPKTCQSVLISNLALVYNNREVDKSIEKDEMVSCGLLPKMPNVSIRTFPFQKESSIDLGKEKVKCFMVFAHFSDDRYEEQLLKLEKKYGVENCSMWGGVVENLVLCRYRSNGKICFMPLFQDFGLLVTFSGSGIDTYSTIVDKKCKKKDQVENRLKAMKEHVKLRKHSIGFMFACCARGEHVFSEKHVEATLFKKVFPQIPLIGSVGEGEIGKFSHPIPGLKNISTKKRVHSYTTSFLIITYG